MTDEPIVHLRNENLSEQHRFTSPPQSDRWCFGLSHPYISRLIFLAGSMDEKDSTPTMDGLVLNFTNPS